MGHLQEECASKQIPNHVAVGTFDGIGCVFACVACASQEGVGVLGPAVMWGAASSAWIGCGAAELLLRA
jgi:hypothetical protein